MRKGAMQAVVSFSGVVGELAGDGFALQEAIEATIAISKLPSVNDLWRAAIAKEFATGLIPWDLYPDDEHRRKFFDALVSCSPRERECYYLFVYEGLEHQQIARKLAITPKVAQKYSYNARGKVATFVAEKSSIGYDSRADEVLDLLTEKERDCFLLHRFGGLGYRRIAQRLGISRDAARMRIKQAHSKISLYLSEGEV